MSVGKRFVTCISVWFFLLFSAQVHSHALKVFAYFEGDLVKGSVYFSGGLAAKSANVSLVTLDGEILQQLTTDDSGEFVSDAISIPVLSVVADSSDGHRGQWQLEKQTSELSNENTQHSNIKHSNIKHSNNKSKPSISEMSNPSFNGPSEAHLSRIVEQAIAAQVGPLRDELHRFQDRARMSDIVGGIGFIFGIAGFAMWWRTRGMSSTQSVVKTKPSAVSKSELSD